MNDIVRNGNQIKMKSHGKHQLSNKKRTKSVHPVKRSKVTNRKKTIELITFSFYTGQLKYLQNGKVTKTNIVSKI